MSHAASRPLPSCPALRQQPASISAARFTLVVEDCEDAPPYGRKTATEVFAYFHPVREAEDDTLPTDSIVVPIGSPIADMAHEVGADLSVALALKVEASLRSKIASCECTGREHCPALSEMSLLEALESALGRR